MVNVSKTNFQELGKGIMKFQTPYAQSWVYSAIEAKKGYAHYVNTPQRNANLHVIPNSILFSSTHPLYLQLDLQWNLSKQNPFFLNAMSIIFHIVKYINNCIGWPHSF